MVICLGKQSHLCHAAFFRLSLSSFFTRWWSFLISLSQESEDSNRRAVSDIYENMRVWDGQAVACQQGWQMETIKGELGREGLPRCVIIINCLAHPPSSLSQHSTTQIPHSPRVWMLSESTGGVLVLPGVWLTTRAQCLQAGQSLQRPASMYRPPLFITYIIIIILIVIILSLKKICISAPTLMERIRRTYTFCH